MTQSGDFPVGYKKPPIHSRFKSGKSGNPRGRPKKSTVGFELVQELNRCITIRENGTEQKATKAAALAKSLVARALGGDMRAVAHLIRLLPLQFQPPSEAVDTEVSAFDAAVLQRFFERQLKGSSLSHTANEKLGVTQSNKESNHG